jgi:hypothetical protein
MLLHLIPLVAASMAANSAHASAEAAGMSERSAQVRLADMLGNVDSIDAVVAKGHTFTFLVEHADATGYDAPFAIIATTDDSGKVIEVVERERKASNMDLGGLTWLVDTMQQTIAVTKLDVDEDGAVTLTTNDNQRYMAIVGRGSGGTGDGNTEVDAHWAGEFDRDPQS